jgi:hypothetical protein
MAIRKVNTTTHLVLQHNQLMSERGILRLKSAPSRRNGALSDGGSITPNSRLLPIGRDTVVSVSGQTI